MIFHCLSLFTYSINLLDCYVLLCTRYKNVFWGLEAIIDLSRVNIKIYLEYSLGLFSLWDEVHILTLGYVQISLSCGSKMCLKLVNFVTFLWPGVWGRGYYSGPLPNSPSDKTYFARQSSFGLIECLNSQQTEILDTDLKLYDGASNISSIFWLVKQRQCSYIN